MGSEIAARNRKSLATFHRTLKSPQCNIAFLVSEITATSGVCGGHRNIANRKNRCNFGALRTRWEHVRPIVSGAYAHVWSGLGTGRPRCWLTQHASCVLPLVHIISLYAGGQGSLAYF